MKSAKLAVAVGIACVLSCATAWGQSYGHWSGYPTVNQTSHLLNRSPWQASKGCGCDHKAYYQPKCGVQQKCAPPKGCDVHQKGCDVHQKGCDVHQKGCAVQKGCGISKGCDSPKGGKSGCDRCRPAVLPNLLGRVDSAIERLLDWPLACRGCGPLGGGKAIGCGCDKGSCGAVCGLGKCGCDRGAKLGCDRAGRCGINLGPKCGCDPKPKCGCDVKAKCGCDVKAKCGCDAKAKCGCERPRLPLLPLGLGLGNRCGCDSKCGQEPKCGCGGKGGMMMPSTPRAGDPFEDELEPPPVPGVEARHYPDVKLPLRSASDDKSVLLRQPATSTTPALLKQPVGSGLAVRKISFDQPVTVRKSSTRLLTVPAKPVTVQAEDAPDPASLNVEIETKEPVSTSSHIPVNPLR